MKLIWIKYKNSISKMLFHYTMTIKIIKIFYVCFSLTFQILMYVSAHPSSDEPCYSAQPYVAGDWACFNWQVRLQSPASDAVAPEVLLNTVLVKEEKLASWACFLPGGRLLSTLEATISVNLLSDNEYFLVKCLWRRNRHCWSKVNSICIWDFIMVEVC